mgnify:FL=1
MWIFIYLYIALYPLMKHNDAYKNYMLLRLLTSLQQNPSNLSNVDEQWSLVCTVTNIPY